MPGTVIRDAGAPNLATGATLDAAGTTTGDVYELPWSGNIGFEMVTPNAISGTSPTLRVEIQACDSPGFSSGVVTLGVFDDLPTASADAQENLRRFINVYNDHRYVRASVTCGGSNPVYTGLTIYPVLPHDRRNKTVTA